MRGDWKKSVKLVWTIISVIVAYAFVLVSLAMVAQESTWFAVIIGGILVLALFQPRIEKWADEALVKAKQKTDRLHAEFQEHIDRKDPGKCASVINALRAKSEIKYGKSRIISPQELKEILRHMGACVVDYVMESEFNGVDADRNFKQEYVGWHKDKKRASNGVVGMRLFHKWTEMAIAPFEEKSYFLLEQRIVLSEKASGEKAIYMFAKVSTRMTVTEAETLRFYHLFIRENNRRANARPVVVPVEDFDPLAFVT